MPDEQKNKFNRLRNVSLYTTIPIILLAGPALGYFIGNFLDNKLNTDPWLMIVFIVMGFAASVKETISFISKGNDNNADNFK